MLLFVKINKVVKARLFFHAELFFALPEIIRNRLLYLPLNTLR